MASLSSRSPSGNGIVTKHTVRCSARSPAARCPSHGAEAEKTFHRRTVRKVPNQTGVSRSHSALAMLAYLRFETRNTTSTKEFGLTICHDLLFCHPLRDRFRARPMQGTKCQPTVTNGWRLCNENPRPRLARNADDDKNPLASKYRALEAQNNVHLDRHSLLDFLSASAHQLPNRPKSFDASRKTTPSLPQSTRPPP